ncbi:MAG TPA: AlkA N-terminal domain-containing protein [Pyrinomonadaceae bacterium]|nr:AlkA N-terminal domain-containing protein [Pyrinomonadaceae bacterium]
MTDTLIRPRPPFDFDSTARFFRFTEAEIVDTFEAGAYARALHVGGKLFVVNVRREGTPSRPSLSVSLAPARGVTLKIEEQAVGIARRMFSVEHDLRRFRARVAGDEMMSRLEAEHRGLRLPRWPTLFEALASSILLQQIATSVAWTFRRRFVERFGETVEQAGRIFYAFPTAERVARVEPEELRALGLTNAKAVSIVEAARAICGGALDDAGLEKEDNETVVARLSNLRGVGRWTAEWVLMLYFGRTDVFAAADLFLRGAIAKYYNDGEPMKEREVRAVAAERFGEWGSYAALYLLAGMRSGSVTLKPGRVLSSAVTDAGRGLSARRQARRGLRDET